ncbi:MAG: hypothetical protein ACLSF6_06105 [Evtepia gabavorous]
MLKRTTPNPGQVNTFLPRRQLAENPQRLPHLSGGHDGKADSAAYTVTFTKGDQGPVTLAAPLEADDAISVMVAEHRATCLRMR